MSKTDRLIKALGVSAFLVSLAAAPAVFAAYGSAGGTPAGAMGASEGKEMTKEMPAKPMDDAGLTAKVKEGLMADSELKMRDIKVEAMQGTVKMTGMVDSKAEKDKAVALVKKVEGVKEVKDGLTVKGETPTK